MGPLRPQRLRCGEDGHVFAVGKEGAVVRFDGSRWIEERAAEVDLVAVWGTGPDVLSSAHLDPS